MNIMIFIEDFVILVFLIVCYDLFIAGTLILVDAIFQGIFRQVWEDSGN